MKIIVCNSCRKEKNEIQCKEFTHKHVIIFLEKTTAFYFCDDCIETFQKVSKE